MIEAYSQNVTVNALEPIPFNNVSLKKGCTVEQSGPSSFALNKCGIYEVFCGVSAEATETIQLYKNGVAQPQAQSTGITPSFKTLVQVSHNNCPCDACDAPVNIQVIATTAGTLTDANIVITKLV